MISQRLACGVELTTREVSIQGESFKPDRDVLVLHQIFEDISPSGRFLAVDYEPCDLLPEAVTLFRQQFATGLVGPQALAQIPGVR
jgi:hypothetical protein